MSIEIDLDDATPTAKKPKASKPAPEILLEEPVEAAAEPIVIDVTQPAIADTLPATASTAPVDASVIPNERDHLMQLVGQAQAFNASADLLRTFGVSKLAYIKETKGYKALAGSISPNGSELRGTWEEFCGLIGMSVDKVDADISNLRAFGEDALEAMSRMGIGLRDLAQYRKLPEDKKTVLLEAALTGDKDVFLDLAETIMERHAAEKAEMTAENASLTEDLVKSGNRANNLDAEIERLTLTNERLVNKQRVTKFETQTEDVRHECMHLQAGVELHFDSLNKLFESVWQGEHTPEQHLRVEQVFISINTAIARGVNLLNDILETVDEDLPKRVQGQNIMTPEEAERWLLEWESLKNAHGAAEAARQIKRDNDRPRGRGRPSKTQGE